MKHHPRDGVVVINTFGVVWRQHFCLCASSYQNLILEVAVKAPCFNNNQCVVQMRLFWCLIAGWVAAGCIFILQAVAC
jgi:hypothetical protein